MSYALDLAPEARPMLAAMPFEVQELTLTDWMRSRRGRHRTHTRRHQKMSLLQTSYTRQAM